MFMRLMLMFTIVPLVELALLLEINKHVGLLATIALVVTTGVIGAALAKSQGRQILGRIQHEMNQGNLPGDELVNGLCVLVGGVLLVTPGVLTDILGFVFVIPVTRRVLKNAIKKRLQQRVEQQQVHIYFR